MSGLESFSDWVLALLPRLFVYPGGVWLLSALVVLRLASGGRASISLKSIINDLSRANLFSLSLAWAAISLLSLPGAALLPFPVDRLALTGLVAASVAFDRVGEKGWMWGRGSVSVAVTLAIMAPVAGHGALLTPIESGSPAGWLSVVAVLVGLTMLSPDSLSGGLRWLGWLGLGLTPVWSWSLLPSVLWVSVVYGIAIAALPALRKVAGRWSGEVLAVIVWGFAVLTLLVALLA